MEDDKEGSSSNVEKTITTNEEASTFKEEADKKAEKDTTQNDENISEMKKSCEIEKEEEKNNCGEVIPKPSASNDSKAELATKIITNTKNSAEDNTTNSDEKQQQNSSDTKSREIEKKSHEIEKELTKVIANANKLVGEGGEVEEENNSSSNSNNY